jgi:hypothetical protein
MNDIDPGQITICFYIHHHGAGHIMRAISIAAAIRDQPLCFMGSNLAPYADLISEKITCIHLPLDLPADSDTDQPETKLSFLHYAPLGVKGIRNRSAIMADSFNRMFPMILIVDVSVEVTLFARLCGIPTIVMLQHGQRNDLPHRNAYESAELLIAPFAATLSLPQSSEIFSHKTLYSGGFSRYSLVEKIEGITADQKDVAVLLGKGGTSIDTTFIRSLAAACTSYTFHVIGGLKEKGTENNIIWQGQLDDPLEILRSCAVVMGNAGHNTVMEMADLNKRFICIPEERPFEEQVQKAAMLAVNGHAMVIQPGDLYRQDWPAVFESLMATSPNWEGLTDEHALHRIAEAIKHTAAAIYGTVQQ